MKYISVILSLIIITLIAVPCNHVSIEPSREDVITSQHSNDSENYSELCSPFSSHDSCSTIVILPEMFKESLLTSLINSKLKTKYVFSYTKDFSNGIFQPPRI